MLQFLKVSRFFKDDRGAVSVDWTVLSAAAVALALATAAGLQFVVDDVTSRVDGELREQQLSDDFIEFRSQDFEALYEVGLLTPEEAEVSFNEANELLNQQVIDFLEDGIEKLEAGTLTDAEIVDLVALASVARQRNVISDDVLDFYFGGPDAS